MDNIFNETTAVFVLGMHRSGTSTLARGLVALGVDWGKNLLEAKDDNPKGFWEDKELHAINRDVLNSYCSDGEFAYSMAGRIDFSKREADFTKRIDKFILARSEISTLWGCKDPRCSLTFPLWNKRLQSHHISPKVVMIFRNPLEVALSLNKRDAMPIEDGLMLWFSYNCSILQNARDSVCAVVSYDDLLTRPAEILVGIAQSLAIDQDNVAHDISEFATTFVTEDLRHHEIEDKDVQSSCSNAEEVFQLYQDLRSLSRRELISATELTRILSKTTGFGLFNRYLHSIPATELQHQAKQFDDKTYSTLKIYFDTGQGYSETESISAGINVKSLAHGYSIPIDQEKAIKTIRIDPCNNRCVVDFIKLEVKLDNGQVLELSPSASNACLRQNQRHVIDQDGPQFIFTINGRAESAKLYFLASTSLEDFSQKALLSYSEILQQKEDALTAAISQANSTARVNEQLNQRILELTLGIQDQEQRLYALNRKVVEYSDNLIKSRKKAEDLLAENIQRDREQAERYRQKAESREEVNRQHEQIRTAQIKAHRQTINHLEESIEQYDQQNSLLKDSLVAKSLKVQKVILKTELQSQEFQYVQSYFPVRFFHSILTNLGRFFLVKHERQRVLESKLFDTSFYLDSYPDIQRENIDPVKHFIETGWRERRRPSAEFDTAYYIERYDDVALQQTNPLLHYIQHGQSEGRHTNLEKESKALLRETPYFDQDFYLNTYPDIKEAGIDPVEHYYHFGAQEERKPSLLFDTKYYLATNQDVVIEKINPLIHYILYGEKDGRIPSIAYKDIKFIERSGFFDEEYYLRRYPNESESALEHFYFHGWKEHHNPSQQFDTSYYLSENVDVAEAQLHPLVHYLRYGRFEGRYPSRNHEYIDLIQKNTLFDTDFYRNNYPDVEESHLSPAEHYYLRGWREKRNPSESFNTASYLTRHGIDTDDGINPLVHHILRERSGEQDGTEINEEINPFFEEHTSYTPSDYYEKQEIITSRADDIQLIAYHLPQFHRMPENDEWWGEGFTEWTKVRAAKEIFPHQYQPRIPHTDIGYYDLTELDTLKKQAELASIHGISGFCFYYYWFSGKRLMEKPIDMLIAHPEIDLKFCLCWANESWTRRWDGQENEILIKQDYSPENDIAFITELADYLRDPRYIKHNNKPIILIYRPDHLPAPLQTTNRIRNWCRENGIGEIFLLTSYLDAIDDPVALGFDAGIERPMYSWEIGNIIDRKEEFTNNPDHMGVVYSHEEVVDYYSTQEYNDKYFNVIRGLNVMWDPSARHEDRCHIIHLCKPTQYNRWLDNIIFDTRKNFPTSERFVFINAWNEWAEGTYLEPDTEFGYAMLNATSKALLPYELWINCVEGGGTASYVKRKAEELQGHKNILVWNLHTEEARINLHDRVNLSNNIKNVVTQFNLQEIRIVSLVFDENIYRTMKELILLKNKHASLQITYQFHDYYPICPSLNLLDANLQFCNPQESPDYCADCLWDKNKDYFQETNQLLWRAAWKEFLNVVDSIEVFSESSATIAAKVYPDIAEKINIIPHNTGYLTNIRKPEITLDTLHLGFLGETLDVKGYSILESMVVELESKNIPVTMIGRSERECHAYFTSTGQYELEELPAIIENEGINLFLQFSVWPETFCYTVAELIYLQLPIICFDLGGQADLLKNYPLGRTLPLALRNDPVQLLQNVEDFFQELKKHE